jgi:hypothetical protein
MPRPGCRPRSSRGWAGPWRDRERRSAGGPTAWPPGRPARGAAAPRAGRNGPAPAPRAARPGRPASHRGPCAPDPAVFDRELETAWPRRARPRSGRRRHAAQERDRVHFPVVSRPIRPRKPARRTAPPACSGRGTRPRSRRRAGRLAVREVHGLLPVGPGRACRCGGSHSRRPGRQHGLAASRLSRCHSQKHARRATESRPAVV